MVGLRNRFGTSNGRRSAPLCVCLSSKLAAAHGVGCNVMCAATASTSARRLRMGLVRDSNGTRRALCEQHAVLLDEVRLILEDRPAHLHARRRGRARAATFWRPKGQPLARNG
eukprot:6190975-Pleurochrysis_carterae.AAC.1